MTITIRNTEIRDWSILKKIRLNALVDAPTAFGETHEAAVSRRDEEWQERASPDSLPRYWLAFKDSEVVGMIGGGIDKVNRYTLIAMWVEPKSRGKGLAHALVNNVKLHAASLGYHEIFLSVSPENQTAVALYLSQGFVFIDESEPLASYPNILVQTMKWQAI